MLKRNFLRHASYEVSSCDDSLAMARAFTAVCDSITDLQICNAGMLINQKTCA